ncbi:MAG TPA: M48 family peptidase [Candidatus Sulfopaludibacter sp.]|nr:M48 family peptidase [Candidatus Sulfopaludibacter sp.]
MPEQEGLSDLAGLQSSLFFETPQEIYARVFRALKPRTPLPGLCIESCRFANADCFIRLENGQLHVRISDMLEGAPAPVTEALAFILLGKLYRKTVPRLYTHRYRLYLNRKDVRRQAHLLRQIRGRKFISGPQGDHQNLETIFEGLNAEFFHGLLGRPQLGWSRNPSRRMLGHFDPSHNAIIISRIFDRPGDEALALRYVMFHEMLHLRFPVEHGATRRCVHSREFREAEKRFPRYKEAKEKLKRL